MIALLTGGCAGANFHREVHQCEHWYSESDACWCCASRASGGKVVCGPAHAAARELVIGTAGTLYAHDVGRDSRLASNSRCSVNHVTCDRILDHPSTWGRKFVSYCPLLPHKYRAVASGSEDGMSRTRREPTQRSTQTWPPPAQRTPALPPPQAIAQRPSRAPDRAPARCGERASERQSRTGAHDHAQFATRSRPVQLDTRPAPTPSDLQNICAGSRRLELLLLRQSARTSRERKSSFPPLRDA